MPDSAAGSDGNRYFSIFGINGKSSHIFGTKNDFGGLAMQDYIERRVLEISHYMLESKGTVRQTASVFGVSKSTVHKDLTERLPQLNEAVALRVREILEVNKAERHIRGGEATKRKYASSAKNENIYGE